MQSCSYWIRSTNELIRREDWKAFFIHLWIHLRISMDKKIHTKSHQEQLVCSNNLFPNA
jgi:hypothetical protein